MDAISGGVIDKEGFQHREISGFFQRIWKFPSRRFLLLAENSTASNRNVFQTSQAQLFGSGEKNQASTYLEF